MKDLQIKLEELIGVLKKNNTESYEYFVNQKELLDDEQHMFEAVESLKKSYSIIQYANFSFEEEKLYNQMYDALETTFNSD
ncbi:hypothetical protein [Lunatibacter salilacus]|uniref:hypothetical protein n=1 Tax=Lunatibacter salilacus TaxID=2483804 RepID=UPI00131C0115|nr:hypothetical protein [Lunatibacter salilacus]